MTYELRCEKCGKAFISSDREIHLCGLCKLEEAREAARERLEGIKRKLGAEGTVRPWEGL